MYGLELLIPDPGLILWHHDTSDWSSDRTKECDSAICLLLDSQSDVPVRLLVLEATCMT